MAADTTNAAVPTITDTTAATNMDAHAPTTFAETILLGWCAVLAGLVATTRHRVEFLACRATVIANRGGQVPPVRGIGTLQKVDEDVTAIRAAIEAVDPKLTKPPVDEPA